MKNQKDLFSTHLKNSITNYNTKKDEDRFSCDECRQFYQHNNSLGRHKKYECGKLPQFHCQFCPAKYKQKFDLHKHNMLKHNESFKVSV